MFTYSVGFRQDVIEVRDGVVVRVARQFSGWQRPPQHDNKAAGELLFSRRESVCVETES